jgi:hypothetical protein
MTRKKSARGVLAPAIIAAAALIYFSWGSGRLGSGPTPSAPAPSSPSSAPGAPVVMPAPIKQQLEANSPMAATVNGAQTAAGVQLERQLVKGDVDSLPEDLKRQLSAPPPELPDDLKRQLSAPPPELPADLKAQLEAPPPELPDDIKQAMTTPPRVVTLDEVNKPPAAE